jgi:hypothetical protein
MDLRRPVNKKASAPFLAKLSTVISDDGRFARFTAVTKLGQNLSFVLPYDRIGSLIATFQNVSRTMAERLATYGQASETASQALASAPTVRAVAMGCDADTGDMLLWLETSDGGPFSFRLDQQSVLLLEDSLNQHAKAIPHIREWKSRSAPEATGSANRKYPNSPVD